MTNNVLLRAKELANQPYLLKVVIDDSDESELLYVAINPELEGCVAQGFTIEEAIDNLNEFRVDYVLHFLENNIPVPVPRNSPSTITGELNRNHWVLLNSTVKNEDHKMVEEIKEVQNPEDDSLTHRNPLYIMA